MCQRRRQQYVLRPVGDEASVGLASPVVPLIWVPAHDRHYQCDRRPLPLALEAPHHRRDEQRHRRHPPPQKLSSLLPLSQSRRAVELVRHWSGVVDLV